MNKKLLKEAEYCPQAVVNAVWSEPKEVVPGVRTYEAEGVGVGYGARLVDINIPGGSMVIRAVSLMDGKEEKPLCVQVFDGENFLWESGVDATGEDSGYKLLNARAEVLATVGPGSEPGSFGLMVAKTFNESTPGVEKGLGKDFLDWATNRTD